MAKVRLDHILAPLGIGEMTSDDELEELIKVLREKGNTVIKYLNHSSYF